LSIIQIINPANAADAVRENIAAVWSRRSLLKELTRREISEQYVGQVLGFAWAIAHPLFLMALFVFIFGYVFGAKVGGDGRIPQDYAVYILSGLLPWLGLQQIMSRACSSLTGHANLVKQVIFPVEILPIKTVLAGYVTQGISLLALLFYYGISYGLPPATAILLPVLIVFQLFAMIGIAYFLSALTVFVRDLKDIVQVFSIWGVYLAPIVYMPLWLPEAVRPVLYLNPVSYMVWCYQDVLYYGRIEHPWAWVVFGVGSAFLYASGYRTFRRLKRFFGERL